MYRVKELQMNHFPTVLETLLIQREELKAYKGLSDPNGQRIYREAKAILDSYIQVERRKPQLGEDELEEIQAYINDLVGMERY
jgi:hypothetical protein